MAPDDAADLLHDIEERSEERSEEILNLMEIEESDEVRELMQYADDTAGGLMTTDFVKIEENQTVQQAIEHIVSLEMDDPFYYAYVVSEDGKLTGLLQLWELLKPANRRKLINELIEEDPVFVHTNTDQEEVARIASKYDLSSLPVLDAKDRLVGRVTVDDILDVIEEEASEDIFKFAGSSDEELITHRRFKPVKCDFRGFSSRSQQVFVQPYFAKIQSSPEISQILVLNVFADHYGNGRKYGDSIFDSNYPSFCG